MKLLRSFLFLPVFRNAFCNRVVLITVLFTVIGLSQSSLAADQLAPEQVVKNTINTIVDNIQANRDEYRQDGDALRKMLEETLIPALHVPRMANLILGRKYSRSATEEQKQAFANEFKIFLMNSYAEALLEYTGDQKVVYKPVLGEPGADKVQIQADLVGGDGQAYPIILFMSNRKDTRWRAYNMDVAGINFVATYRATFGGILDTKGVDGLIEDLRSKNARL